MVLEHAGNNIPNTIAGMKNPELSTITKNKKNAVVTRLRENAVLLIMLTVIRMTIIVKSNMPSISAVVSCGVRLFIC